MESKTKIQKIRHDTNPVKIICKDKDIILQEGILPDIDYINAIFNFQKTQGQKELSLEFAKYESWMINEILTNEFINKEISFTDYSVSEFYKIYEICHEINYTKYYEKLIKFYMDDNSNNTITYIIRYEKKLFELLNVENPIYQLTYFSEFIIKSCMIHIIYLTNKASHYYIWLCTDSTKKYLKNINDRNNQYIVYNSIEEIYHDLTDEYFDYLETIIKDLIVFCEKYKFYKDVKSLPMRHLQHLLKICKYDIKSVINIALSNRFHINK